jgi:hypothetical protein
MEDQYVANILATIPYHTIPIRYVTALCVGSSGGWTSGFFPGTLWYLYNATADAKWRNMAIRWTEGIRREQNNTGTHGMHVSTSISPPCTIPYYTGMNVFVAVV